jgi:hypothetical protein
MRRHWLQIGLWVVAVLALLAWGTGFWTLLFRQVPHSNISLHQAALRGITQENYWRIREGMTIEQVQELLGVPPSLYIFELSDGLGGIRDRWPPESAKVAVWGDEPHELEFQKVGVYLTSRNTVVGKFSCCYAAEQK